MWCRVSFAARYVRLERSTCGKGARVGRGCRRRGWVVVWVWQATMLKKIKRGSGGAGSATAAGPWRPRSAPLASRAPSAGHHAQEARQGAAPQHGAGDAAAAASSAHSTAAAAAASATATATATAARRLLNLAERAAHLTPAPASGSRQARARPLAATTTTNTTTTTTTDLRSSHSSSQSPSLVLQLPTPDTEPAEPTYHYYIDTTRSRRRTRRTLCAASGVNKSIKQKYYITYNKKKIIVNSCCFIFSRIMISKCVKNKYRTMYSCVFFIIHFSDPWIMETALKYAEFWFNIQYNKKICTWSNVCHDNIIFYMHFTTLNN